MRSEATLKRPGDTEELLAEPELIQSAVMMPSEEEISLLDLLIVIMRRRRLILRVTVGAIAVGVLLSFLLPTRYTATTVILPPSQGNSSGAALMAQLGSLGSMASMAGAGALGLKNPNDLQVAMLKSRTVEYAMIDRFHLLALYEKKRKSDARKKFESFVDIDSGVKDGLIRISVTDRDPNRALAMANGYVEEFKKLGATLALTEASQRRLFFEQQLSQAKDNLAAAEEALKKTEQKTGLIQLDSQARAVIGSVAQLRAQIAAKQVQIGAMRSFATGENPDLKTAESELAGLETELAKTGASSDDMLIPRGNMQQSGLEYVRRLRDVKYYETIFDLLARQYEAAKVDEARQGAVVQVVDPAVLPDRRSSPKRTLIVAGCAIFGLCVGVFWALAAKGLANIAGNPAEHARLETLKRLLVPQKKNPAVL